MAALDRASLVTNGAGPLDLEKVRFGHRDRSLVERILRQPPALLPLEMNPPMDISEGAQDVSINQLRGEARGAAETG